MITQDDIAAFADENEEALKAAREFARRAEKGIPADRWYDGVEGAKMVAKGIRAHAEMAEMFAAAFWEIHNEKMKSAQDAMRLHTQDSKYVKNGS